MTEFIKAHIWEKQISLKMQHQVKQYQVVSLTFNAIESFFQLKTCFKVFFNISGR